MGHIGAVGDQRFWTYGADLHTLSTVAGVPISVASEQVATLNPERMSLAILFLLFAGPLLAEDDPGYRLTFNQVRINQPAQWRGWAAPTGVQADGRRSKAVSCARPAPTAFCSAG